MRRTFLSATVLGALMLCAGAPAGAHTAAAPAPAPSSAVSPGAGGAPAAPDSLALPDSLAEAPEPPPYAGRLLAWTPAPPGKCRIFLVTEASLGVISGGAQDYADSHMATNSAGVMINAWPRTAIGGAFDLRLSHGEFTCDPALRVRRWFGSGRQSLEGSLEWADNAHTGLDGPLASVRYSPNSSIFLEAGVCRVRERTWRYDATARQSRYTQATTSHGFASLGVAGPAAAGVWTLEAVLLGALLVALSGFGG